MTPVVLALLGHALAAVPGDAPCVDCELPAGVDGLSDALQRLYREGVALEARGDFASAATAYRVVANGAPTWPRPALDLARVLEAAGRTREALAVYEGLPFDADAVEARGRLLGRLGRWNDAATAFRTLRDLRPEWAGARLLEAEARAAAEPDLAAGLVEEYLGFDGIEGTDAEVARITRVVAGALRDAGEHAAALGLLGDVLARMPEAPDLGDLALELEVDEQARALAEAADVPLDPDQLRALVGARETFAAGGAAEARAALEALVAEQPLSAAAWAALADVCASEGALGAAEQAVRAAERLDPLSAAHPAALGDLLSRGYAGRYDDEAALAYARAVQRRPDDPELWYRRATAERRSGGWARSVLSFQRLLALDPDGPHAAEAAAVVEGAGRARPEPASLPPAPGRPSDVPEEAWWAFHRAWAWTIRAEPDTDRALAELAVARGAAPRFLRAIELEASIRADRGELDAAIAAITEELRIEPDRASAVGRLARLHEAAGHPDEAAALWDRAADLGDPDALWRKAQAEASSRRWWAARATLATFFAHTSSGPAYADALALDRALRQRISRAQVAVGAAALGVLALPVVGIAWRRGGSPLGVLTDRAPHTWRDVARICSAIRHEVLKHHTAALADAAIALERGDPEPARWLAERLFDPVGPLDQLEQYVRDLEAMGRANGIRLNLRRDEVFGPLLAQVDQLRQCRSRMEAGDPAVAAELRAISDGLNRDASRALSRRIGALCVLELTAGLVRAVVEAVRAEPALRDRAHVPVDVVVTATEPLHVRIFRTDLADIVANLVRNALEAAPPGPDAAVAVVMDVEEDELTALEQVVIRVCDRADRRLTTSMLRGRYVERGLGLALDLVNRAAGSMAVEAEPGWAKALVVRLPRVEAPGEEEP